MKPFYVQISLLRLKDKKTALICDVRVKNTLHGQKYVDNVKLYTC